MIAKNHNSDSISPIVSIEDAASEIMMASIMLVSARLVFEEKIMIISKQYHHIWFKNDIGDEKIQDHVT